MAMCMAICLVKCISAVALANEGYKEASLAPFLDIRTQDVTMVVGKFSKEKRVDEKERKEEEEIQAHLKEAMLAAGNAVGRSVISLDCGVVGG